MVAVDPQLRRRSRHQLGQTEGIFGRINVGLILTFPDDHCVEQTDRDAMFTCNIAHQSIIGRPAELRIRPQERSEEHTSELQSLMRSSYAVFCLKKKKKQ